MTAKYRDQEYTPELGDTVEVYDDNFEPEVAVVKVVGKKRIKVEWTNESITPRQEWIDPANADMISREG